MGKVKKGDSVKVHYSGSLDDGTLFDSSENRDPLEFTIGDGKLIPGFEEAVLGMSLGESKTITIASDQAYGPRREELLVEVERKQFPSHISPEIGQQLQIPQTGGRTTFVTVTDVTESTVTVDANHPLAGKDLIFQIELIEVAE